jgi:ABC-type transport system involved in multi-copper enzyme maturation permease subunit
LDAIAAAYHWWRGLKENPVYLREKGVWGKPNPFYERLAVFIPFIIMGGLVLGLCVVPGNLLTLAFANENEIFFLIYCLLCLPAVLLQALTWFGVIMAPALTATTIGREIDQGNWDILRLTPQSVWSIVWAKLLGGLARLRVWPLIWALSLVQALAFGGAYLLAPAGYNWLWAAPMGLATLLRPSLEIFLAGLMGITVSIWVRSAIMALVTTYGLLILFKLTIWLISWLTLTASFALFGDSGVALYYLLPTAVHLATIVMIAFILALSLRQWL